VTAPAGGAVVAAAGVMPQRYQSAVDPRCAPGRIVGQFAPVSVWARRVERTGHGLQRLAQTAAGAN
jgi:hypothetical protein